MSPNFHIAYRFLTAKKRAMLMSLSCTVLGVGLFILTQATTSGFEEFFIKTILGTDGAIRIEDKFQDTLRAMSASSGTDFEVSQREGIKYIEGVEEPNAVIKELKNFSNVIAAAPVLRGSVQVRSSFKNENGQIYGIDIDEQLRVSDLGLQVIGGSGAIARFRENEAGAIVGRVLADRLQVEVGQSIQVMIQNELTRLRVTAIFETGVQDIDKIRLYVHMSQARSILRKPTGVSFVQVSVHDRDRAPQTAAHIQWVLKHAAKPWQVREKTWLETFSALKLSSAITVSIFTLIAGLAMFNTLAMIVLEKTKDIAILRSMGYERSDITRIFLWQALIVLTVGAVLGCLVGAGTTFAVSHMPLQLTGIFKTDTFQVYWSPWHYVAAITSAAIMVMIASLFPARRAARFEPGDIVRGTAQ